MLKQFMPRFNRRFGVPAQCPDPSFRPLQVDLPLEHHPVLQAPQEGGQGQHREVPEAHPAAASRSKAPKLWPERLWRSWRDWRAGYRYTMRGASSLPRKRRPVRHLSEAATGTSSASTIPTPDPGLALKPSVTALELPSAKPDQEEGAHAAAIDDPDVAGLQVVASPRKPTFLQQERWKGGAAGEA